MAFTSYGNGGFDMLSRGLGMLGQDITNYQQNQKLSELGQQVAAGKYDEAAQAAIASGNLPVGLALAKLGQANKPDPTFDNLFKPSGDTSGGTVSLGPLSKPAPVGGFDNAVNRTLGFEGGMNPNDSNGSPSNYGINAAANPDVNVADLTPDKAKALYKSRYWDPMGLDNVDPRLAHVAFDTAVIAGPGKAQELMDASGGDPNKMLGLRSAFQGQLLQSNPDKFGPYAKAWGDRLAGLKADISAPGGGAQIASSDGSSAPQTSSGAVASDDATAAQIAQLEGKQRMLAAGVAKYTNAGDTGKATALKELLQITGTQLKRLQDQQDKGVTTLTPEEVAQIPGLEGYKGVVQKDATGKLTLPTKAETQVNIDQKGETAESAEIGKGRGKALIEYVDAGRAAREGRAAVDTMKMALEASNNGKDITTGPLAETILGAKQALGSALGITLPGTSAAEVLQKMNTYLATAAAKSLTSRPAQMEFMQYMKSNPGILTSPQGTAILLDIVGQNFDKQAALSDIAAKSKTFGEFLPQLNAYERDNPIRNPFASQQQGQAVPPEASAAAQRYKAAPGGQGAALAEARKAIAGDPANGVAGKDPAAVTQRLRELGIDPSGL